MEREHIMPKPSMLPSIIREIVSARNLLREPEPDLVMDEPDQVAAYADAGRTAGGMAAAYLFHTGQICKVIAGRQTVVDLACGPGTLLAQIAELNPDTNFTGIDLSHTMLETAHAHAEGRRLTNINFRRDDITCLESVPDHSVDAVISTMALHHLPNYAALKSCFLQIRRILKPNGAIYLSDFTRPKQLKSVIKIAYSNMKFQPYIFSLDTERSIRAAFLLDEFKALANDELPHGVRIFTTFMVPLFVIIKTEDSSIRTEQKQYLRNTRRQLPKRFRGDLDDMRFFFRLGGLKGDPFRL
jgi:arsenite methyltransferase